MKRNNDINIVEDYPFSKCTSDSELCTGSVPASTLIFAYFIIITIQLIASVLVHQYWYRSLYGLIPLADRPHPRDQSHKPPDYRHTDNSLDW